MTTAAGKEVPAFFLPLLFSFWLYRLHFLIGTPLHTVLWRREIQKDLLRVQFSTLTTHFYHHGQNPDIKLVNT